MNEFLFTFHWSPHILLRQSPVVINRNRGNNSASAGWFYMKIAPEINEESRNYFLLCPRNSDIYVRNIALITTNNTGIVCVAANWRNK